MTDWNLRYETGDTPWDRGAPTPVLEELTAKYPGLWKGRVAVPGCGLGYDARWLEAKVDAVTALDISSLALERAREKQPDSKVHFQQADIMDPPSDLIASFDVVWEHTCLSALHPTLRKAYAAGLASMLKKDGTLAGVFFINPEMAPGEEGPPFAISAEELIDLWSIAGLEVIDQWVPSTGYPGRVGRELVLLLQHK